MRITKEFLESESACADGVAAFCAMFPDGFDLSEWTREKQIEIVKSDLRQFLGWAFSTGVVPLWSMQGASLDGANLDGASLFGASLFGASLNRAKYSKYTVWPKGFDPAAAGARLVE